MPSIVKAYLIGTPLCALVVQITTFPKEEYALIPLKILLLSAGMMVVSGVCIFFPIWLLSLFLPVISQIYKRFSLAFFLVVVPILFWHFFEPIVLRYYGYQWISSLDGYASTILPNGPGWNEITNESEIQIIRIGLYSVILILTILLLSIANLWISRRRSHLQTKSL